MLVVESQQRKKMIGVVIGERERKESLRWVREQLWGGVGCG